MESSHKDLLNDMAEHQSILKSTQNTYYARDSFTPLTGKNFLDKCIIFTVLRSEAQSF